MTHAISKETLDLMLEIVSRAEKMSTLMKIHGYGRPDDNPHEFMQDLADIRKTLGEEREFFVVAVIHKDRFTAGCDDSVQAVADAAKDLTPEDMEQIADGIAANQNFDDMLHDLAFDKFDKILIEKGIVTESAPEESGE